MPIGRIMILFLCICFLRPCSSYAESDDEFRQQGENWLQQTEQILLYIEKGKYTEAREQLHELSKQFAGSDLSQKHLTVEGIHILAEELVKMEQRLNQVVISDPGLVKQAAMRLKLTFDAVSHPNQPLWKQYYQSLQRHIASFKQSEAKKDTQGMKQAITGLTQEYRLIRSALVISKKPETITKLDSLVQFLERQKTSEMQAIGIKRFQEILTPLFFGSDQDVLAAYRPYVNSEIMMIMSWIVFWLTVVLGYVGWRKYQLRQANENSIDVVK